MKEFDLTQACFGSEERLFLSAKNGILFCEAIDLTGNLSGVLQGIGNATNIKALPAKHTADEGNNSKSEIEFCGEDSFKGC